jgi:hypothetical protein
LCRENHGEFSVLRLAATMTPRATGERAQGRRLDASADRLLAAAAAGKNGGLAPRCLKP